MSAGRAVVEVDPLFSDSELGQDPPLRSEVLFSVERRACPIRIPPRGITDYSRATVRHFAPCVSGRASSVWSYGGAGAGRQTAACGAHQQAVKRGALLGLEGSEHAVFDCGEALLGGLQLQDPVVGDRNDVPEAMDNERHAG
jgi:hypothetical protein